MTSEYGNDNECGSRNHDFPTCHQTKNTVYNFAQDCAKAAELLDNDGGDVECGEVNTKNENHL